MDGLLLLLFRIQNYPHFIYFFPLLYPVWGSKLRCAVTIIPTPIFSRLNRMEIHQHITSDCHVENSLKCIAMRVEIVTLIDCRLLLNYH